MKMSNEYLNERLSKVHELLYSGSLHEIDEANNIVVSLIGDLQPQQAWGVVSISKPPNLIYEKDIKNHF